jgi:hypothetical protein
MSEFYPSVPLDRAAIVVNGSAVVEFSSQVTLDAGQEVIIDGDPITAYGVQSVSNDGFTATLKAPYGGPSSTAATVAVYGFVPPSYMQAGTALLASGTTSMQLTLASTMSVGTGAELQITTRPDVVYRATSAFAGQGGAPVPVNFLPAYIGPGTPTDPVLATVVLPGVHVSRGST